MIREISIQTGKRAEFIDITDTISRVLEASRVQEGICIVWVPHTTAGVTVNENADPDVVRDILTETEKFIPVQDGYRHREGNSAAHIKSSLFGPQLTLVVTGGHLLLGTWQSVYFCEFDGPRNRRFSVKIVEA